MEKCLKNGKQVGFLNSKFLLLHQNTKAASLFSVQKNSTIIVAIKRVLWAGDLLEVLFGACISCTVPLTRWRKNFHAFLLYHSNPGIQPFLSTAADSGSQCWTLQISLMLLLAWQCHSCRKNRGHLQRLLVGLGEKKHFGFCFKDTREMQNIGGGGGNSLQNNPHCRT